MYVCLCKGLTDKQIVDIINKGHDTLKKIGKHCGAGTDCGDCRHYIRNAIRERKKSS